MCRGVGVVIPRGMCGRASGFASESSTWRLPLAAGMDSAQSGATTRARMMTGMAGRRSTLGLAPWFAQTQRLGYSRMPVVLRAGGFRVVILLPPREHGPPHVHVWNSDGEAVIDLAAGQKPQRIRDRRGMRESDVAAAFQIVEEQSEYLLERWRELHG